MRIRVGHATDVGLKRKRNEDSHFVHVPWSAEPGPSGLRGLLVVADGMGGERGGAKASSLVCDRFRAWFTKTDYRQWDDLPEEDPLAEALRRAFVGAGREVLEAGLEDSEFRGMGTTAVLVALQGEVATIAHIGDSRCYRIRAGRIDRLTADHSWVEKQVEAGLITTEQAREHPHRNILLRSMGDEEPSDPDILQEVLCLGDVLILCTDGLTGGVPDEQILDLALAHEDPKVLADALVRVANEQDGSDNVTVVVARCEDEAAITDEIVIPDLRENGASSP